MSHSLASFLLPAPLMHPELWPPLDEAARWLLPLDVATATGGPLKTRFEELLMHDRAAWFLPAAFFEFEKAQSVQREIRFQEAASWLKTFPGVRCYSDQPKKIPVDWLKANGWPLDLIEAHSATSPGLFAWSKEIFPELLSRYGELKLRSALSEYQEKMPTADVFPWQELRFFAGFQRQKGSSPEFSRLAAFEWAKFQALFSPQNETSEARSLPTDALQLNPTVQILRSEQEELITLLLRWNDRLHVEKIGWREAFIIDEVSESPKIPATDLLKTIESESAGLPKIFEKSAGAERAKSFSEALRHLTDKHIILRGF